MTYYGAKELSESFLTVRKNTLTIAEEIPEQHYNFKPSPEARSVAQTLIHIANITKLQEHIHGTLKLTTLVGFDFPGFLMPIMEDEQKTHTKLEILTRLNETGEHFGHWLASLSESFLAERVAMPPQAQPPADKSRFEMIMSVKEHEMHHRAQLMMMQRMLGIVPHLTRQMNERIAAMMAQQKASA